MARELRNEQWTRILEFLKGHSGVYVGNEAECRRFIQGVLWVARTGAPWRDLPERYGNWNSVYRRFSRWSERGIWQAMLTHFADEPDMEWLMLDSSVVRAHMSAAGASKKTVVRVHKRSDAAEAASAPRFTPLSTA